jgi:hypothetical protein
MEILGMVFLGIGTDSDDVGPGIDYENRDDNYGDDLGPM